MKEPNLKLKSAIYEVFPSQALAAREFGIDEFRLSRLIHGRATPKREEKRRIAWKLQKKISELFPE